MSVAKTETVTLTPTTPHRVVIVGCSYLLPTLGYHPETGQEVEVMAHKVSHHGEIVELTDPQARRLLAMKAVVTADAPLTYPEMTDEQLQALVAERGIAVKGTGANDAATHEDLVAALTNYDIAAKS